MSEFLNTRQFLIDQQPDHIKTLFVGTIDQMILQYRHEKLKLIDDLYRNLSNMYNVFSNDMNEYDSAHIFDILSRYESTLQ